MNKYIYGRKSIDELTFTDDGIFQAVLRNPDVCIELVERLLHVHVKKVEYPELEKQIAPFYTTKGVRLDVYLKDEDKIIDVEMQSYQMEALGKRTRYYQSMIDMDSLMKGEDYPDLKDSYILFICKDDPFKTSDGEHYNLPCYTFKNTCAENSDVKLNDNSLKVIYNASAYKDVSDRKIRDLLQFVCTNEPGKDGFTARLSSLVEELKENEKFRSDYAAMNLHDRDITRAAKREGAEQKAIEAAQNLLRENISPETIARCTGLSLEKVLELQKELESAKK